MRVVARILRLRAEKVLKWGEKAKKDVSASDCGVIEALRTSVLSLGWRR